MVSKNALVDSKQLENFNQICYSLYRLGRPKSCNLHLLSSSKLTSGYKLTLVLFSVINVFS